MRPSGRLFGSTRTYAHQGGTPYPTETAMGIQYSRTPYQTPNNHSSKNSVPHLQKTTLTPKHIPWISYHGILLLWHAIIQMLHDTQRRDKIYTDFLEKGYNFLQEAPQDHT